MALSDRLRAVREREGWTQDDAATRYGIPPSTYKKYEAGAEPGAFALARMLSAGIDVNALLHEGVSEPTASYVVRRELRLNRGALAAILQGLLAVNKDPVSVAEQLASIYEHAFNTGQITEDGIGPGDKASAA